MGKKVVEQEDGEWDERIGDVIKEDELDNKEDFKKLCAEWEIRKKSEIVWNVDKLIKRKEKWRGKKRKGKTQMKR